MLRIYERSSAIYSPIAWNFLTEQPMKKLFVFSRSMLKQKSAIACSISKIEPCKNPNDIPLVELPSLRPQRYTKKFKSVSCFENFISFWIQLQFQTIFQKISCLRPRVMKFRKIIFNYDKIIAVT